MSNFYSILAVMYALKSYLIWCVYVSMSYFSWPVVFWWTFELPVKLNHIEAIWCFQFCGIYSYFTVSHTLSNRIDSNIYMFRLSLWAAWLLTNNKQTPHDLLSLSESVYQFSSLCCKPGNFTTNHRHIIFCGDLKAIMVWEICVEFMKLLLLMFYSLLSFSCRPFSMPPTLKHNLKINPKKKKIY